MTRTLWGLIAAVVIGNVGCSQAFRFTEETGINPDGGLDGGTDAGTPCQLPGECECIADINCPGTRPHCDGDHRCVECTVAADCGTNGLCDGPTRRCTTSCSLSSQCTGIRNSCSDDPPRHCRACDDSVGCGGLTPFCSESVGYCVQCRSDLQCSSAAAHCDLHTGTCVKCFASAHCAPTEYCVLGVGICAQRP